MNKKNVPNIKGAKNIVNEIESVYQGWLGYSNLSEEKYLSNRNQRPFNIIKNYYDGVMKVSIGIGNNQSFQQIGEPFVSRSVADNKTFITDLSLILFYLATKLDMENKRLGTKYIGEKDDYFYQKVKDFVTVELNKKF